MTTSLQKGIDAAKSGMMEQALAHLKDAIVEEPENANVWVWLSAIIEDEEKQTIFLKKALEIDPDNRPAQRGLAFIQRKKYIPPKPGEKLSDYTRPIGIFKTPEASSPAQAAENFVAANQPAPAASAPVYQPAPTGQAAPKPRRQWLDIMLYGLTLMVFIVIGILVGTTLLNADLPFLGKPTPVLTALPPKDGVFLMEKNNFIEMKLHLNAPQDKTGIPETTQSNPKLIINTHLVTLEQIKYLDSEEKPVLFKLTSAENNRALIQANNDLKPGQYCLVYNLNQEKKEALYWCFSVVKP